MLLMLSSTGIYSQNIGTKFCFLKHEQNEPKICYLIIAFMNKCFLNTITMTITNANCYSQFTLTGSSTQSKLHLNKHVHTTLSSEQTYLGSLYLQVLGTETMHAACGAVQFDGLEDKKIRPVERTTTVLQNLVLKNPLKEKTKTNSKSKNTQICIP